MNKINFNKFIWFTGNIYIYIYIYIYIFGYFFFGCFSSSWNEKKMSKKKKEIVFGNWMGYCPCLVLGHNTTDCIVTQQG